MASSASQLLTPPAAALAAITSESLLAHIEVLSSEEFEGRAPGSKGEALSVGYITDQFKRLGLEPGNPDGTYVQDVPLAGIKASPTLSLDLGQGSTPLRYPQDFVAASARLVPEVEVKNSEVVFVGYGIVAPEYGWDDYKDVDVRGKTILMLINDPVLPDPHDPAKPDDSMFKGRAMTYYGRWTYKYEIAARKGAAAAIIIHETGPAGYPYSVVETSWNREIYDVDAPDRNLGAVGVRSWITLEVARQLLAGCGQDFDRLKSAAQHKDFRPVRLGTEASFTIASELRSFRSPNLVARLEGSDPARRDECVIYSAHWDHLGRSETRDGETKIFHGAVDNASGVASLLELARAFTTLEPAPKCSVLFMAPTAEESGLLGARYYASHPVYPLAKTLANINIDGVNPWGKTRDIENICAGHTTLDDLFAALAAAHGRVVLPATQPEKGYLYRADHFEFFRQGVPCLYPNGGKEVLGKPEGYGRQKTDEYTARHYHQPSDKVDPGWDLSGAVEDTQLLFEAGYQMVVGHHVPEWKPHGEFKAAARRDAALAPRKANELPAVGVEPTLPYGNKILSLARLPISPRRPIHLSALREMLTHAREGNFVLSVPCSSVK